jgi:HSP20 family molecular chaperone IbpA
MTRATWFDSPFLLGFDRLQELAERAAHIASDGYPPYNIEATGKDSLRVTLAVAGFARDELVVELDDRQLTVSGEKPTNGAERAYLHRGIATRRFRRTFLLADGYEVVGALLENGLLHVDLKRPERQGAVQRIAIKANGHGSEA